MSTSAAQILDQAMALPEEDREQIGLTLLQSTSSHDLSRSERDAINAVLIDRVDGPFKPISETWAEDAKARLRKHQSNG
tara:strand:- start:423 stop:659 length:237 start_codon:yes stop_codon:yes gene_type:complete